MSLKGTRRKGGSRREWNSFEGDANLGLFCKQAALCDEVPPVLEVQGGPDGFGLRKQPLSSTSLEEKPSPTAREVPGEKLSVKAFSGNLHRNVPGPAFSSGRDRSGE